MSKQARIDALERVLSDPRSTPYTVMEASKEIRRLSSRRRRTAKPMVPAEACRLAEGRIERWCREWLVPTLAADPDAVDVDELVARVASVPPADVDGSIFKFWDGKNWPMLDGSLLYNTVDGCVWRRTSWLDAWHLSMPWRPRPEVEYPKGFASLVSPGPTVWATDSQTGGLAR